VLKLRLLTVAVLLPAFIAAVLLLDTLPFSWLMGLVVVLASWEWSRLARIEQVIVRLLYTLIVALLCAYMATTASLIAHDVPLYINSLFWLVVIILMTGDPVEHGRALGKTVYTVIAGITGVVLLVPLWVAFVRLHGMPDGAKILLGMCVLVWLADTGAYATGRALGKHKLAPRVSPGKTIEGVIGGMIAAMLAALAWPWVTALPGVSQGYFVLIAALTVVASVYGDLLESVFKRIRGVKDSGKLLPGHGGILDRIDSMTAASPVFMTGLLVLGNA
jgi:phosphatidate cytidylyltransferase